MEITKLFRQNMAIEIRFKTQESGFHWELIALDFLDLYYLPLIKKPQKILIYGIVYLQFNNEGDK